MNTVTRSKENQPFALRFNSGKMDWTIIDFPSLKPLVDALTYGEHKYSTFRLDDGTIKTGAEITKEELKGRSYEIVTSGRDNWKMGFSVAELQKSQMRHVLAMLRGEEIDPESGVAHIGLLMANNLFISYYTQTDEGKPKRLDKTT